MPRKKKADTPPPSKLRQLNPLLLLQRMPAVRKAMRWMARIIIAIALIDLGYMMAIWPEWKWYSYGPIPKSQFIINYERQKHQNPVLRKLRWSTIAIDAVPDRAIRVFLAAEDSRFFHHGGIDTEAFKKAMEYNWERKRFVYGASTISQQTAKNLFLSPSRDPFRKWHELALTFAMENNLSKRRILELYLNVAEFGPGIYGIEAASQYYFKHSAKRLTARKAAELAATLPAPSKHNPKTRSDFFLKKVKKIRRNSGIS
jgi:monofunctional biosynthetic peptidoglycan transglycosylase